MCVYYICAMFRLFPRCPIIVVLYFYLYLYFNLRFLSVASAPSIDRDSRGGPGPPILGACGLIRAVVVHLRRLKRRTRHRTNDNKDTTYKTLINTQRTHHQPHYKLTATNVCKYVLIPFALYLGCFRCVYIEKQLVPNQNI